MGSVAWVRLAEPVHLIGPIWRVAVPTSGHRPKARARGFKITDPGKDVDDRLGRKTGHGGAADVMDAACGPVPDRRFEQLPLLLETSGPGRVVGRDPHRLTGLL
jgi:hypothetical protein